MTKNSVVLCISDTHIPYHHPDTLDFLIAVKNKYKPDRVVHLGDEVDHHAMTFHTASPELFSAGIELENAKITLKEFYKEFPKVDVMESNHGSLAYRKAKAHGIPLHYLRGYNDVLDAPRGWKWHNDLYIRLSNGQLCYFCHGKSSRPIVASKSIAMNVVQGHYHTVFSIEYWSNPKNLFWGMSVGCSIDDKSRAYDYNKVSILRPIVGHGIIIDGQPKLLPMILKENGRWNGKVP